MEYYIVMSREILPLVTTWVYTEGLMFIEITDRERHILYTVTNVWNLKKANS